MIRLAALCAVAFAALAVAVQTGAVPGDASLSAAAVGSAQASSTTTRVAQVVEALTQPVWVYLAGLVGVVLAHRAGRRRQAFAALVAGAAASVASPVLKAALDRGRPALEAGLTTAGGGSFPSGHALASATVVLAAVLLLAPPERRGVVALLGATELVVVSVDRIWLGAHWPTDVLGSWLLAGALVGAAAGWARRSQEQGHGGRASWGAGLPDGR